MVRYFRINFVIPLQSQQLRHLFHRYCAIPRPLNHHIELWLKPPMTDSCYSIRSQSLLCLFQFIWSNLWLYCVQLFMSNKKLQQQTVLLQNAQVLHSNFDWIDGQNLSKIDVSSFNFNTKFTNNEANCSILILLHSTDSISLYI